MPSQFGGIAVDIPQGGSQFGGIPVQDNASQSSPNYGEDIEKSLGSGAGKTMANIGAEALVHPLTALANTVARPIVQGATRLGGAAYEGLGGQLSEPWAKLLTYPMGGDPDSNDEKFKQILATQAIPAAVKGISGMDMNYQPQTKPGEYASSVGSALPYAAVGLPPSSAVGMGLGSQAGKDIASQFTDNPKYQEAASVAGGGMGALVAPSAAAKATDLLKDESTSKTGMLGLPKGTTSPNEPVDVSVEQMKDLGTQAYKSAEAKGGIMGQQSFDKAVDDAVSKGGNQMIKGQAPPGTNYVIEVQDYLNKLKGTPTSLAELDKVDDFIRDKIGQAFRGGLNKQGADLLAMRDTIRAASKSVTAPDIVNPDAFSEWQRGDKIWTAYRVSKDIQDGIENAQNADVPSTAIKNFFKNFVKNEDNLAPLNNEEIAAAKQAAKYGIITRALKTAGSRLGGHIVGTTVGAIAGGLGGGGLGAAVGAPVGYMAGEAVTAPIAGLANARQAVRGENVINTISKRSEVQAAARAERGLPQITPSTAVKSTPLPAIATQLGASQQAQQKLKSNNNSIGEQNQQELQKLQFPAQPQPKPQSSLPDVKNFAKAESGDNPNAKNPNSSASGLYQFTNKTWNDMVMRYGKQTGINIGDKNNPQAQATMASLLAKDNIVSLQKTLGRMPTKPELYMAHVLGAHGASKLINANPNQEAIMMFPRQVFDANRGIFFSGKRPNTVAEVQNILSRKVA